MALNENIVIRLMADTSNYTTKMQAASTQAETMAKAMEKPMTTGQRMEAGFTKAGLAVGALSAAIGVAAVKSFMDFDASMSMVQANTGASGKEMNKLRDAALEAGARTVYSATESADAINELAKAGMSTSDVLNGGLNGALDLAASDGMAVSEAAELMSSTLSQFNLTGKDATKVADALAAGAGKAQGDAKDLGYALGQSGMVAHSFGISMEETTGTLASFAHAGMIGSDAGTSLKSMLIALANPSKKAQQTMDDLGISAYDAQGNFVGLDGLAGQLQGSMKDLTVQQRNQALATIFGSDAVRAANVLYNEGTKGIDGWTKAVSDSGYASKQAAARNDNLKGDIEQLSGAVETMLDKIGSGANGPFRSLVQNVTNVINAFGSLDPQVQQTIVLLGMGAGAVAGLHKMFGNLSTSSSGLSRNMGLVLDPVQRFRTAAPQLSAGLSMLTSAFHGPEQGVGLMANGLTRGKTAMSGLKSVGGGLMSMLGGPWGIAMTAAAIGLDMYAQNAATAKAATDEMKTSMQAGADSTQKIVQMIKSGDNIDWGWWQKGITGAGSYKDLLDKLGISYATAAKAATGNKIAIEQYNGALEKARTIGFLHADQVNEAKNKLGQLSKEYKNAQEATKAQAEAEKEETKQKVANTVAQANGTQAVQEGAAADEKAADSKDILAEAFGATTKGVSEQAGALGEVVDALKTYYGFAISASDADIQLHDSFDKATQAVKDNGAILDLNTPKGRANQSALNDIAKAAMSSAEAHARAGDAVDKINPIMEDARNHYIEAAKAMGKTPEEANAMADSVGLSAKAVQDLTDRIAAANAKPLKIDDQASKTLTDVGVKAKSLPDGKTIKLSGDNKEALQAFATVNGLKIDPKTGTLDLNKQQFEVALAIANGAKINPKTGELLGDNSDHWRKIAQSNGWKIDRKTGVISGDDGPFRAVKGNVDKATIGKKTVQVGADASGFWSTVNGILGQVFHVNVSSGEHHASGGLINGPGTGTSDDIPAKLSNGEYVVRAAAVKQYGVGMLNAINWQRYATGGPVRKYEATPLPSARHMAPEGKRIVYNQYITNEIHSTGSSRVDEALLSARVRAGTGAMLQGRTL